MQSFRLFLINRREFIHQSFITRLAMFLRNYCDITFMYTLVIFLFCHHPPIITPAFCFRHKKSSYISLSMNFSSGLSKPFQTCIFIGVRVSRKRHWFALDSVEFCALGHPEPILGLLCLKILSSLGTNTFFLLTFTTYRINHLP